MTITFYCPNGHKLNCKDKLAGRPGTCPKCHAAFTVPSPPTADAIAEAPLPAAKREPWEFAREEAVAAELAAVGAPMRQAAGRHLAGPPTAQAAAPGEPIVFLCPNGHRLHSPPNMIGRPGQCPQCQARFLIPSPEEMIEEEDAEAGPGASPSPHEFGIEVAIGAEPRETEPVADRPVGEAATPAAAPLPVTLAPTESAALGAAVPPRAAVHPLASLFAHLWTYRSQQGAVIEVHLADGKLLMPETYAPQFSSQTHALFAEKEATGNYRLTALAWDSIARVVVRGATRLAKGAFDE